MIKKALRGDYPCKVIASANGICEHIHLPIGPRLTPPGVTFNSLEDKMKNILVLLMILCLSSLLLGCTGQIASQSDSSANADPTPALTLESSPDPYFVDIVTKAYMNNEYVYVTSITVGRNVINGGEPGNVFVSVDDSPSLYASKIFYMD